MLWLSPVREDLRQAIFRLKRRCSGLIALHQAAESWEVLHQIMHLTSNLPYASLEIIFGLQCYCYFLRSSWKNPEKKALEMSSELTLWGNDYDLNSMVSGTEKNRTATDMTGIYAFFSARKTGNFLHILGPFPYWITQQNLEKSTGENSKNPAETAPRNCRFLSLVVVECVLMSLARSFSKKPAFKIEDFLGNSQGSGPRLVRGVVDSHVKHGPGQDYIQMAPISSLWGGGVLPGIQILRGIPTCVIKTQGPWPTREHSKKSL